MFLVGHLFGNLKVFQGPESLNAYAAFLQGHPLVWVFRAGLLTVFILHVWATLSLRTAPMMAADEAGRLALTGRDRCTPQAPCGAARSDSTR